MQAWLRDADTGGSAACSSKRAAEASALAARRRAWADRRRSLAICATMSSAPGTPHSIRRPTGRIVSAADSRHPAPDAAGRVSGNASSPSSQPDPRLRAACAQRPKSRYDAAASHSWHGRQVQARGDSCSARSRPLPGHIGAVIEAPRPLGCSDVGRTATLAVYMHVD